MQNLQNYGQPEFGAQNQMTYYVQNPNPGMFQQNPFGVQPQGIYVQQGLQKGGMKNSNNKPDDQNGNNKAKPYLFKTKLCPMYTQGSGCPKGDKCLFAHSQEELRSRPNLSKTKLCEAYLKGQCGMGEHCNFAHSELELKSTPDMYKTALCNNFTNGTCRLGDICRFAHGEADLRINMNQQGKFNKSQGQMGKPYGHGGKPGMHQVGGNNGFNNFNKNGQNNANKPMNKINPQFPNPMEFYQQQQGFVGQKEVMGYQNYMPMIVQGVPPNVQTVPGSQNLQTVPGLGNIHGQNYMVNMPVIEAHGGKDQKPGGQQVIGIPQTIGTTTQFNSGDQKTAQGMQQNQNLQIIQQYQGLGQQGGLNHMPPMGQMGQGEMFNGQNQQWANGNRQGGQI